MVGRQLPFFSLIVPFWVVWAQAGFRGMLGVWPAPSPAGVAFAIPQFLVSNKGPWLVDIAASICSIGALVLLLKVWETHGQLAAGVKGLASEAEPAPAPALDPSPSNAAVIAPQPNAPIGSTSQPQLGRAQILQAWVPWLLLSVLILSGACRG